jgi:hypothetical protein
LSRKVLMPQSIGRKVTASMLKRQMGISKPI